MIICGEKVVLKPMAPADVTGFYKWATDSDGSPFWYGGPYGDPIPSFKKFREEWQPYYFDGSQPEKGRCFLIQVKGRNIGEVNYNDINKSDNSTELDIIIASAGDKGKGYGPDALKTLAGYLFNNMGVELCFIEPVSANERAIRAYEKAGFRIMSTYEKDGMELIHMELRKKEDD